LAGVRDVGQLIKAFEEFGDNPVRRFQALFLQEVKPDDVNIEDGIFGEPKRVQLIGLDPPDALLSIRPTSAALLPVRRPGRWRLFQGSTDLFIKSAAFILSPTLFSVQSFQGSPDHVLGIGKCAGSQAPLHQGLKIGSNFKGDSH